MLMPMLFGVYQQIYGTTSRDLERRRLLHNAGLLGNGVVVGIVDTCSVVLPGTITDVGGTEAKIVDILGRAFNVFAHTIPLIIEE